MLIGLDLTVGRGVTGLLGPNGSGKTTLIGMLLGLHAPDQGRLQVLGLEPREAGPEVRARLGYAPQHDALPGDREALDLVRHLGEVHGLPREAARRRASDVLWQVGLGEERSRQVGTMSGGQRQRVKLACALVHDPSLLLLDEPTNGLDPGQRDGVLHLVRQLSDDLGVPVLMSSHLLEEVERVCEEVIVLSEGRAVLQTTLRGLGASAGVFEVVLAEADAGELGGRLRRAGHEVVVDGRRLEVRLAAGDEQQRRAAVDTVAHDVVEAAAALGVALRRLQARGRSLQEAFLGSSAP